MHILGYLVCWDLVLGYPPQLKQGFGKTPDFLAPDLSSIAYRFEHLKPFYGDLEQTKAGPVDESD